jgi:hypothetical protein
MYKVEELLPNQEKWQEIGSGTEKTIVVTAKPSASGISELIEVRVQLSLKGEP